MITHRFTRQITVSVLVAVALVGCGAGKQAVVDKVLEDSGVEVDGLGKELPDSFPADVPVPTEGVELESAVGASGTFALRYGVTDPAAATAAYRAALDGAGFTIDTDFDNLGAAGNNVGFIASNEMWQVSASAFGEDPVDGLYMGVSVTPVT